MSASTQEILDSLRKNGFDIACSIIILDASDSGNAAEQIMA